MTYPEIDCRGRSCPEPVILTKKAIASNPEGITVLVDNSTSCNNVTRFARNAGYQVQVEQDGPDFRLKITK